MSVKPILYENGVCRMLDQRLLPTEEVWIEYTTCEGIASAIRDMVVRGAPAIGVAAAFGAAFGARDIAAESFATFFPRFAEKCDLLAATRPTAVNLFWALDRMKQAARKGKDLKPDQLRKYLLAEACTIAEEDEQINRRMGQIGNELIPDAARILTHCNAGALATGGYGTALGVVRAAAESGKKIAVFADETRPFLQGARLTAWELQQDGIDVTLICDNMAGYLMSKDEIDCIIVGADRIAANGDVANKIGTFTVAVLAQEHNIPFYVAAPTSTIDLSIADGSGIPIEERSEEEVTHHNGQRVAPTGIKVRNPAFDVTPARLVTAIITEHGIARDNYIEELAALVNREG
ncbi:MAG: S-methyl-5-thioribose-1-phosphate isomerase [Desulfuromonas sp.]|nr:MAG: S-methyl-5-thioribose-1-phosphate isomerase [Desulfuromonas sp.]